MLDLMNTATRFGPHLKSWRVTRGQSQMSLALSAGVSTRHVSYLETGKASPSRDMVVSLAQAMDLPLRARNHLLVSAGFAPLYPETRMDAAVLEPVRNALQFVLAAMEPHPTFIVNRRYDVVDANESGRWVLASFIQQPDKFSEPLNMAELIVRSEGMASFITNLDEVQRKVLTRLRRDLDTDAAPDERDKTLLALIEPTLNALGLRGTAPEPLPLMAGLRLHRGNLGLNFFTTIATIGTAQDVTLQELRIETLFPADALTREVLAARVSTGAESTRGSVIMPG